MIPIHALQFTNEVLKAESKAEPLSKGTIIESINYIFDASVPVGKLLCTRVTNRGVYTDKAILVCDDSGIYCIVRGSRKRNMARFVIDVSVRCAIGTDCKTCI